jgi:hypothetical protein
MRWVPRTRRHRAIAAGLAAVVLRAASAHAAPGVAPAALDHPPLNHLPRVGLIIVGARDRDTLAARALAGASLLAAGHEVVFLPASTSPPARPWVLALCAANDLDAVGLVRISTATPDWRVNVDIRDPEGRSMAISGAHDGDLMAGGGGGLVAVDEGFSFTMRAADVAAHEQARAGTAGDDLDAGEVADEPPPGRPRLWVSDRVTMFGPVRISDGEFLRLVGRPDLGNQHSVAIGFTRTLGFTALGMGLTGVLFATLASGWVQGDCADVNAIFILAGRPASCGATGAGLFVVPLALAGIGSGLVIVSFALAGDRPSLETRKALAREYNARVAVSAAPSLRGDGGVMLINGRF